MNTITRVFHELTHRVPGIAEHSDRADTHRGRAAHHRHGRHGRGLQHPNSHHQNSPRVLVVWQNRIARLVHADH